MLSKPGAEVRAGSSDEFPAAAHTNAGEKRARKRRLPLSCGECRKKKLSCDRNWPCQRCLRSGWQHQCSFETPTGQPPVPNAVWTQRQQPQAGSKSDDEIRQLRAEVAHLKKLLSRARLSTESDGNAEPSGEEAPSTPRSLEKRVEKQNPEVSTPHTTNTAEPPDHPKYRAPRGYYNQHSLFKFFIEVPELYPLIKETADEWLKPAGVDLKKAKLTAKNDAGTAFTGLQEDCQHLEALLPPKDDTDDLVAFYLDHLEHLHRVVHVLTFRMAYAELWIPGRPRHSATVALVLSMIAISACTLGSTSDSTLVGARYWTMVVPWIMACDKWLRQRSPKHRKLVYYQISCLVYLGKRINGIHKKIFWTETGSLIQSAILDGLCWDPSPVTDSPFMSEMKRRIWHVLRELDLQNATENGLPSLLHNIDSNVSAPANIDDEEFGKASVELPSTRPTSYYTQTSYQSLSARTWTLRLEISRRLISPAFSHSLNYDDVLHYTHEITQAMHDLPSWDSYLSMSDHQGSRRIHFLAHAFLQFQLKEYILALHRPYLQRGDSRFWLSENICYHTSREMLVLNLRLAELGVQGLAQLRADLLLASLTLTRITMQQALGPTNIIMNGPESAIEVLEQCLPLMEDRHLRCCNSEPWCFITMCSAVMLLKVHLGKENRQTAKYSVAQRFLGLHFKHVKRKEVALKGQPHHQLSTPDDSALDCLGETIGPSQQAPLNSAFINPLPEWLGDNDLDIGIDSFSFDMALDNVWDDTYGST